MLVGIIYIVFIKHNFSKNVNFVAFEEFLCKLFNLENCEQKQSSVGHTNSGYKNE